MPKVLSPFRVDISQRAPLCVMVSRQLRESIISGDIPVDTELPSEKDLAESLGVSRATVREALRILQSQGLISGGETVSTQRPRVTHDQVVRSASLALESVLRLQKVPLDDLVELRVQIEGAAVASAAQRRSPSEIDQIRILLKQMADPEITVEKFRAADLAFHRLVVRASGNAAYPLVMGVLREAILTHLGEALEEMDDPRDTIAQLFDEHSQILEAIVNGDGEHARSLMISHIQNFYRASPQ